MGDPGAQGHVWCHAPTAFLPGSSHHHPGNKGYQGTSATSTGLPRKSFPSAAQGTVLPRDDAGEDHGRTRLYAVLGPHESPQPFTWRTGHRKHFQRRLSTSRAHELQEVPPSRCGGPQHLPVPTVCRTVHSPGLPRQQRQPTSAPQVHRVPRGKATRPPGHNGETAPEFPCLPAQL